MSVEFFLESGRIPTIFDFLLCLTALLRLLQAVLDPFSSFALIRYIRGSY